MNLQIVSSHILSATALFAGLTLFLVGMESMSKGLQEAAGKRLRQMLQRATARPIPAISLGTLLGGLIHSSAASVMLIGFISAGLVTLASSIPVMLGINIGTTLSMLLISIRLGDACWLAILAGFLMQQWSRTRPAGKALLGFGLIFLGLNVMQDAIYPLRNELAPILRFSDGTTMKGMLTGVLASLLFTAIIQSSGATIGMVFALLTAGAMTSFEQAYPVLIGASVGTCATALIGAARSTIEAKRCALTHLLFNIFAASVAMLTAPLMYRFIPVTTPTAVVELTPQVLVLQCAYANVIRTTVAALLILPLSPFVASAVTRILPNHKQDDHETLLAPNLVSLPEDALQAAILELHRMSELCTARLQTLPQLLLQKSARKRMALQETESAVASMQEAMHRFLRQLATVRLTRRQSMLAVLLYNDIDHIERIAEHIGVLAQVLYERHSSSPVSLSQETLLRLIHLNNRAVDVLEALQHTLLPLAKNRDKTVAHTLNTCERFMEVMSEERSKIAADLAREDCTARAAIFRMRYITELHRIVKHARTTALHSQNPRFRIKSRRLANHMGYTTAK